MRNKRLLRFYLFLQMRKMKNKGTITPNESEEAQTQQQQQQQSQQVNNEDVEWYRKEVGEEPTPGSKNIVSVEWTPFHQGQSFWCSFSPCPLLEVLAILQSQNKDEKRVKFHPFSHRKRKKPDTVSENENETKSNSDEKPKTKRLKYNYSSSLMKQKKKNIVPKTKWKPIYRNKK